MPSEAARAAFDEAQRIAAEMRDIHAQEKAIADIISHVDDSAARTKLETELANLRNHWSKLAGQYTDAVGRFTKAADEARRTFPPPGAQ